MLLGNQDGSGSGTNGAEDCSDKAGVQSAMNNTPAKSGCGRILLIEMDGIIVSNEFCEHGHLLGAESAREFTRFADTEVP